MTTSYTRPRKYGRDQKEEGRRELRELLDDPDCSFADILAAAIEHCPPDKAEELYSALREIGEDRRSPHQWARGRLERRQLTKDMRRNGRDQRYGRDEPPPFEGRPRPGGTMDPIAGGRLYDPSAIIPAIGATPATPARAPKATCINSRTRRVHWIPATAASARSARVGMRVSLACSASSSASMMAKSVRA